jgi:hypothetical protein
LTQEEQDKENLIALGLVKNSPLIDSSKLEVKSIATESGKAKVQEKEEE